MRSRPSRCWPDSNSPKSSFSEGLVSESEPKKPFLRMPTSVSVWPSTTTVGAWKNVYGSGNGVSPQVVVTNTANRSRFCTRITSQSAFAMVMSTSISRFGSNQSALESVGGNAAGQTCLAAGCIARRPRARARSRRRSRTRPRAARRTSAARSRRERSRRASGAAASDPRSSRRRCCSRRRTDTRRRSRRRRRDRPVRCRAGSALGSPGQLSSQPVVTPLAHGWSPTSPEWSPSSGTPSVSRSGSGRPWRSAVKLCDAAPPFQAFGAPKVLLLPSL